MIRGLKHFPKMEEVVVQCTYFACKVAQVQSLVLEPAQDLLALEIAHQTLPSLA